MDRVGGGQRDRGDLRHCMRVICRARTPHVRAPPARIGTDDKQVRARRLVLVGDAGRDHDDISGAQLDRSAALAAEPQADPTSGNAEHLMRGAMIVMT